MTHTRQHILGLLLTSCLSLLSLPLFVLLILFGGSGLTSRSTPASNEIWGCSQYADSCVGPQYYQTVIAGILMVGFLVLFGWLGQRIARFARPGLAIAVLSLYSALLVALGLVAGFMLLHA
jgi:hypothetical protein